MTLIEALLSLPTQGEPRFVSEEVAAALGRFPSRFAQRLAKTWSLTDSGLRFLVQFRSSAANDIKTATVRLAEENGRPVFHLLLDDGTLLKVGQTDLKRSLTELRAANPAVKIAYDFRPFSRLV